jgi:hypothetical protein
MSPIKVLKEIFLIDIPQSIKPSKFPKKKEEWSQSIIGIFFKTM